VEASCTQRDTHVLLDGKPWFNCPGTQHARLAAGEHAIVAARDGYLTLSRQVVLAGGDTKQEKIELMPLEHVVKMEYRTRRWIPWSVAGAGGAIALGGLALWLSGRTQMNNFQQHFAVLCASGCSESLDANPVEEQLASESDSGQFRLAAGVSMIAVGGAVLTSGVVWAILNRPHRVTPKVEIAPTTTGATASAAWRF
jgi:hypothetical protein